MTCIYCGCTDSCACTLELPTGEIVGCSWISTEPPVCSAPDCVAELKRAEKNSAASSQADGAAHIDQGDKVTISAPHDGQRPPLSEEKHVQMHETMEHLRARATERAAYEIGRTTGTETAPNGTVPVRKHAPPELRDNAVSHQRNGLQILELVRTQPLEGVSFPRRRHRFQAGDDAGEVVYLISETELISAIARFTAALDELEHPPVASVDGEIVTAAMVIEARDRYAALEKKWRRVSPATLGDVMREMDPILVRDIGLVQQLDQMDATVAELAEQHGLAYERYRSPEAASSGQ